MRSLRLFPLTITCFCVLVLPLLAPAQKGRKAPVKRPAGAASAPDPAGAKRRIDAFDTAWTAIYQSYFDKTFSGLDWGRVYAEFQPRVKATRTDAEMHRLLQEMIDRLGKSHLSIIVPEYFEQVEVTKKQAREYGKKLAAERNLGRPSTAVPEKDAEEGAERLFGNPENMRFGIGVELRMIDREVVIVRVEKQSGASIAGLRPGYVLDKVNGVSIKGLIDQAVLSGSSLTEVRYLLPIELVESMLNGAPDTSVMVSYRDENDKLNDLVVPRLELAGETVSISSNLPDQFLRYDSISISPEVGYLRFSGFAVPVIEKFCNSLSEFKDKKAIIVDLRGNLGGVLASMIGLTAMMTDKPISLGKFNARDSSQAFLVPPKAKNFKGRIVMLVDGLSMSAAEIFTAGLRGNGRVTVVGDRTGGQSLPAIWKKLETGAVMVFPIADFIAPNGKSLEGVGLLPDHVVALDRKSLLAGVDPQLQKAIAVANSPLVAASDEDAEPPPPPPPPAAKVQSNEIKLTRDDPPPPAPKALTRLGTPPAPSVPLPSDAKSLKIFADFSAAAGAEKLKDISAYELKGTMTIISGPAEGSFYSARQFPGKYLMIFNSPVLGEIRELYNGKDSIVQTDYGMDRPLGTPETVADAHILSPLFDVHKPDRFKHLKYEGEYPIDGRKRHIISGRDSKGVEVGFSFDSATGMLTTYMFAGLLYTFNDYRQTGDVKFPYSIDIERMSKMRFDSITLNPKLDPALFEKKEKCFDKPL